VVPGVLQRSDLCETASDPALAGRGVVPSAGRATTAKSINRESKEFSSSNSSARLTGSKKFFCVGTVDINEPIFENKGGGDGSGAEIHGDVGSTGAPSLARARGTQALPLNIAVPAESRDADDFWSQGRPHAHTHTVSRPEDTLPAGIGMGSRQRQMPTLRIVLSNGGHAAITRDDIELYFEKLGSSNAIEGFWVDLFDYEDDEKKYICEYGDNILMAPLNQSSVHSHEAKNESQSTQPSPRSQRMGEVRGRPEAPASLSGDESHDELHSARSLKAVPLTSFRPNLPCRNKGALHIACCPLSPGKFKDEARKGATVPRVSKSIPSRDDSAIAHRIGHFCGFIHDVVWVTLPLCLRLIFFATLAFIIGKSALVSPTRVVNDFNTFEKEVEPLRDALYGVFADSNAIGLGSAGSAGQFTALLQVTCTMLSILQAKVAETVSGEGGAESMGTPLAVLLAALYMANALGISMFFPFSRERNKVFFDGHGYRQVALNLRSSAIFGRSITREEARSAMDTDPNAGDLVNSGASDMTWELSLIGWEFESAAVMNERKASGSTSEDAKPILPERFLLAEAGDYAKVRTFGVCWQDFHG